MPNLQPTNQKFMIKLSNLKINQKIQFFHIPSWKILKKNKKSKKKKIHQAKKTKINALLFLNPSISMKEMIPIETQTMVTIMMKTYHKDKYSKALLTLRFFHFIRNKISNLFNQFLLCLKMKKNKQR